MKLLKVAAIAVISGFIVSTIWSHFAAPAYRVSVSLQADDVYTARNLGTLFEAQGGDTVCRAGFPAGAQTRGKIAQKHIEFTCGPLDRWGREIELFDLGRPGDSYRAEVRSLRDRVVDVAAKAVLEDGEWQPYMFEDVDTALGRSETYVQAVQILDGKKLTFPHSVGRVMHKDKTVLHYQGSLRNGIYYDGRIYVAHFDGNVREAWISYCNWKAPAETCGPVTELAWPYEQDIYGMLGWRGAMYLSTGPDSSGSGSGIWKLTPETDELQKVFPEGEEIGGEFYGMALVGNSLIAGHYPTGFLAVIDADGASRLVEEPSPRNDTYGSAEDQRLYREAQSLNLYAGRLWVGMYPWGFLWEADPSLSLWKRHRLFSWPEVSSQEPTPFHTELRSRYLAMSEEERVNDKKFTQPTFWGQRIHSVALSGDENAVVYGLGNMPGLPYDARRDADFGSPENFHEYGSVRGVRAPNTIIKYIPWTDDGVLNLDFILRPDEMILKHEGQVVERIPADIDPRELAEMRIVSSGFGLYGTSEYELEAVD